MSMYEAYSRTGLIFGTSGGGGGGGTTNFEELNNRPKVNDNLIDKNSTNASLGISKTYTLNNTTVAGHIVFDIPAETITDIYNMMVKGAVCILSDTLGNIHRLVSSADTDGDNVYVIVQYDDILVRYVDDGTHVYKERIEVDESLNETSTNPVMNKTLFANNELLLSELAKKSTVYDYTLVVDEVNGNHFINADDDTIPVIDVFSELLELVLERNNTNVFINVVYPDPDEEGYTPVVTKVPYVLIDAEGDGFVFSAKYRNVEAAISITGDKATFELIEKEDYKAGDGIDITDFEISSSYGTYQPAFRVPHIEKNEEGENYIIYVTYNGDDYLNFMLPDGAKIYMFGRKNPYVLDETLGNELNEDQKAQLHEITGQTFITGMYVPFNVGASLTTVLNNIINESGDIFSPIDDEQPVLIFMAVMTADYKFRFLYITDRTMNLPEFKIESLTKKEIYKIPEKALGFGNVEKSDKRVVSGDTVYDAIDEYPFVKRVELLMTEDGGLELPTNPKFGEKFTTVSELFGWLKLEHFYNKQTVLMVKAPMGGDVTYGYFEFPRLGVGYNAAEEVALMMFSTMLGTARYEIQIGESDMQLQINEFAEEE